MNNKITLTECMGEILGGLSGKPDDNVQILRIRLF